MLGTGNLKLGVFNHWPSPKLSQFPNLTNLTNSTNVTISTRCKYYRMLTVDIRLYVFLFPSSDNL